VPARREAIEAVAEMAADLLLRAYLVISVHAPPDRLVTEPTVKFDVRDM